MANGAGNNRRNVARRHMEQQDLEEEDGIRCDCGRFKNGLPDRNIFPG